jgi:uracil DNA glycosylase
VTATGPRRDGRGDVARSDVANRRQKGPLTVRAGLPRSHRGRGWEMFTDEVIRVVNGRTDRVVFILWCAEARRKCELITTPRHVAICSAHPSSRSARKGFFGSRPFTRVNDALVAAGREAVDWALPLTC